MLFVGIDLHKRHLTIRVRDEQRHFADPADQLTGEDLDQQDAQPARELVTVSS